MWTGGRWCPRYVRVAVYEGEEGDCLCFCVGVFRRVWIWVDAAAIKPTSPTLFSSHTPHKQTNKHTHNQVTPIPDSEGFSLSFLASVPALGWATYYVGVCRLTHWTDYEGEQASVCMHACCKSQLLQASDGKQKKHAGPIRPFLLTTHLHHHTYPTQTNNPQTPSPPAP
jgi:hypothetical protein